MYQIKNRFTGFTLIELIIVVSIIAILASLAYLSFSDDTGYARDAKRKGDLKTIEDAISMSGARNRPINYLNSVTTGTDSSTKIKTGKGDVRVLRNADMFQVEQGFIDSTILPSVERDPYGSPYFAAFLNQSIFQIAATLEMPETKKAEVFLRGSFKEQAIVDNLLISIDNVNKVFPVGNADQFIRGDTIQIDNEKMIIEDISKAQDMIIVTRGQGGSVAAIHKNRAPIKISAFATNASSLYCLDSLTVLTKSAADASALIASEVPAALSIATSAILLDNMYTCTAAGDISHEGQTILYDVTGN